MGKNTPIIATISGLVTLVGGSCLTFFCIRTFCNDRASSSTSARVGQTAETLPSALSDRPPPYSVVGNNRLELRAVPRGSPPPAYPGAPESHSLPFADHGSRNATDLNGGSNIETTFSDATVHPTALLGGTDEELTRRHSISTSVSRPTRLGMNHDSRLTTSGRSVEPVMRSDAESHSVPASHAGDLASRVTRTNAHREEADDVSTSLVRTVAEVGL